jgi:hypothetical protein
VFVFCSLSRGLRADDKDDDVADDSGNGVSGGSGGGGDVGNGSGGIVSERAIGGGGGGRGITSCGIAVVVSAVFASRDVWCCSEVSVGMCCSGVLTAVCCSDVWGDVSSVGEELFV